MLFNKIIIIIIQLSLLDVNECEEYGVCDQLCLNSYGTYTCACDLNYQLVDNHTCKINGNIVYIIF